MLYTMSTYTLSTYTLSTYILFTYTMSTCILYTFENIGFEKLSVTFSVCEFVTKQVFELMQLKMWILSSLSSSTFHSFGDMKGSLSVVPNKTQKSFFNEKFLMMFEHPPKLTVSKDKSKNC